MAAGDHRLRAACATERGSYQAWFVSKCCAVTETADYARIIWRAMPAA
jgi:hypothetical protein